jgi:iron complex outermembrane recepter protein
LNHFRRIDMEVINKANLRTLVGAMSAAMGGMLIAGSATAQTAPESQKLERVEITGSSIKRIEGESALPVTIIRRAEIDRTGATSVADLLDKVSSNNGGGYNISEALGDAARPGFAGASLRALGSRNTLVLLNGRRLSIYAFDGGAVSLNDIPIEAIERIEILRDGASHLYGTDAVAGVINLITRRDYTGGQATLGIGRPTQKAGDFHTGSLLVGIGDLASQGWNFTAMAANSKQDGIKASERSFSKTAFIPSEGINRLSSNAFPAAVSIPGVGLFSPAGPRYNRPAGSAATPGALANGQIPGGSQYGCAPPASYGITDTDGRCRFDYASVINIVPDAKRNSVFLRGTMNLGVNHQISAEYAKSQNSYVFTISPTPASEATTFNGDPLLLNPSSQYYPTAWLAANFPSQVGKPLNLYYRVLETGGRSNGVKSDQDRLVLEAKGLVGTLDYTVGLLSAKAKATESYLGGYISESKLLPAFAAGTINPFGANTGAGLQALLATQVLGEVRKANTSLTVIDARVSTEIMKTEAGSIGGAVGVERRSEKFNDNPLAVLNTGDIIGGAGSQLPTQGTRSITALYGELSIPITKSIEALVAARFDKYSDFGNTTNPKLAIRWQPNKEFLMRSSVGTGFRAPTLENLYSAQTQTNTGATWDDPYYDAVAGGCAAVADGRYCNAQLTVKQGGDPKLTPEKARSMTFGVLFEPTRNLSLSVDAFVIRQQNLIGIISADSKLNDFIDKFDPVTRTSTSIFARDVFTKNDPSTNRTVIDFVQATYANLGNQLTKGLDFSMKLRLPSVESGDYRINWDVTYLPYQATKDPGETLYNGNSVGQYIRGGTTLRWKQRAEVLWKKGPLEAFTAFNWQSGYADSNPSNQGRRVGDYQTFDVGVVYEGVKNLTLRGSVTNLFDRNPPFSNQLDYFQVGYDAANTNPRGRTIILSGTYKFW